MSVEADILKLHGRLLLRNGCTAVVLVLMASVAVYAGVSCAFQWFAKTDEQVAAERDRMLRYKRDAVLGPADAISKQWPSVNDTMLRYQRLREAVLDDNRGRLIAVRPELVARFEELARRELPTVEQLFGLHRQAGELSSRSRQEQQKRKSEFAPAPETQKALETMQAQMSKWSMTSASAMTELETIIARADFGAGRPTGPTLREVLDARKKKSGLGGPL